MFFFFFFSRVAIDGCFFGPNFPMEFLIHYPEFVHHEPILAYKPTLYGFPINHESPAYRCNRFEEKVYIFICYMTLDD